MATAISEFTVTSASPAVKAKVTYDSWRSGENMVYKITVSMWTTSAGGWRNNRWACKLWVNNNAIWTNQTIKAQTSGTIGTKVYSATTGEISVAAASGTIPLKLELADTGYATGWNSSASNFTSWGTHNGSLAVTEPEAPSMPSSITIPSSTAPDKTITVSWSAASGGTNGVGGYQLAYSKDGGSNYSYLNVSGTSTNLDLNALGFIHGSVLKCAVRSYTNVAGTKYYSSWKYSGTTTTSFVAPSVPRNLTLTHPRDEEPIPTAIYVAAWEAPSSKGSNGISGYEIQWWKNGKQILDLEGETQYLTYSIASSVPKWYDVGDELCFKVRAYTIGQDTRYYSNYVTSTSVTIVSDKFIYVSQNGGNFTKYKMYISINGGDFKEVKKEKFKVL